MTAQHHDVQHETPAAEQSAAPERTDSLPMFHKVGRWAMALVGLAGISTMAVAVMAPCGQPWVVGG